MLMIAKKTKIQFNFQDEYHSHQIIELKVFIPNSN
jgi:hypothetical protein